MITPRHPARPTDVATHYDQWDRFYRAVWGDHLHHGCWDQPDAGAGIRDATRRLLEVLLSPLPIRPGERVLDVGCGYGATAHLVAESTGALVTGITISRRQALIGQSTARPVSGEVRIREADWMTADLPEAPFAHLLAIECLSHMPDKRRFFARLRGALAPGGHAVVSCWVAAPHLSVCERLLLTSICRDGSLPALGSELEYRQLMRDANLRLHDHRDLTEAVAPTWTRILQRSLHEALRSPSFLGAAILQALRRPAHLATLPKMILAMQGGALRYHAWWLQSASP